jgi:hypothetical protein
MAAPVSCQYLCLRMRTQTSSRVTFILSRFAIKHSASSPSDSGTQIYLISIIVFEMVFRSVASFRI